MSVFSFKHFDVQHNASSMKVGTDAVLLASVAEVKESRKVLDVGTGCGVIALAVAQRYVVKVDAIDIHKPSVEEARENFANSPWKSRLTASHLSMQDLAAAGETRYDVIISNPPFFSNALPSPLPSRHTARHDDCLRFTDFANAADILLKDSGTVWVILPVHESVVFIDKMAAKGLKVQHVTNVYPKPERQANRKILAFSRSDFPSECHQSSVIIRKVNNDFTDAYKALTSDFYLHF